jgi:hypothetical protein
MQVILAPEHLPRFLMLSQLSNLGMEHRHVDRRSGRLAARLGAEHSGCPVEKLRLPLGDLATG